MNLQTIKLSDGSEHDVDLEALAGARRLREVVEELERAGIRNLKRLVEATHLIRSLEVCPLLRRVHEVDKRITQAFNLVHGTELGIPIPEDEAARQLVALGRQYEAEEHARETEHREHAIRIYNLTVREAAEVKAYVRKAFGHLGVMIKVMRLEEQRGED